MTPPDLDEILCPRCGHPLAVHTFDDYRPAYASMAPRYASDAAHVRIERCCAKGGCDCAPPPPEVVMYRPDRDDVVAVT